MVLTLVRRLPPRYAPRVLLYHDSGAIGEEMRACRHSRRCARPQRRGSGARKTSGACARTCQRTKPHIVHTFLLTASLYGRFAAILARVPVVIGTEVNVYASKRR